MEQAWNEYIPEGTAPDRLKKSLSLVVRRKQYKRFDSQGVEVPQGKPAHLRRSRTTALSPNRAAGNGAQARFDTEVPRTSSVWVKARDAYVNMMVKTTEDSGITSVHYAPKTLDRSLTLGSGFGKKVEVSENSLPFKLTKAEQQYLDHLRKRYDSRYA